MGFGGLITGLGIAGLAALAGGVSLGCAGVVSAGVLSCRGAVVCSGCFSISGAGIFGFITGRGITGFAIGLLTGACSVFDSVVGAIGVLAAAVFSSCIPCSATGLGFTTGRGITGLAIGLLTGACSVFDSVVGAIASALEVLSLFILSVTTGFGFITGFAAAGLAGDVAAVDEGACGVSAGAVSPEVDGGDAGSLGFIIGRATTGFGLACSVSVPCAGASVVLTGGATGNFVSTDLRTSGNASIA